MNECCDKPENRVIVKRETGGTGDKWIARWHEQCKVCKRNHYGMKVEPVAVGLTGSAL